MFLQPQEQYGNHKQCENGGGDHAADDDPGHADPRLRTFRQGKGGGEHAYHHGEGSHENGFQTYLARFHYGFQGGNAFVDPGQGVVQQQGAVLGYQAVHDQDADEGVQVNGVVGEQQEKDGADDAQRKGEHTDKGSEYGFVEYGQQQVNQ